LEVFHKIDLLIFSLFVSLLILIFINKSKLREKHLNLSFFLAILSIVFYLATDIVAVAVNGFQGNIYRDLNIIFSFLFYFFGPLAPFFWTLIVDYSVFTDHKGFHKRMFSIYIYPILLNTILLIINFFNGMFFYVDSQNIYHRGDFFWIHGITYFFYVVVMYFYIVKYRKRLDNKFFSSMLIIPVAPVVAGIFQSFFLGIDLVWPAITVSMLLYFFVYQTNQLNYDYLTGLYNRRSLDSHLKNRFKKNSTKFAGIMIDVFRFKYINDKYGHKIGDEVLTEIGKIIKSSTENEDFLCRYAGDEFFILSEVTDNKQLERRILAIKDTLKKYNEDSYFEFEIKLSIGGVLYNRAKHRDPDKFISDADTHMYKVKNKQKEKNRE